MCTLFNVIALLLDVHAIAMLHHYIYIADYNSCGLLGAFVHSYIWVSSVACVV